MREKLRKAILDAYGIDIDKYDFEFKTSLNAYTINIEDFTIRVTVSDHDISKELRLARLQWAKDLKEFKNTICEPVPSKHGELIEDIQIGKWHLSLTMHRTAKGQLMSADDIRPMFFICAGDMLGTMHYMSTQRGSDDLKYEIPTAEIMYRGKLDKMSKYMNPDLHMRIIGLIAEASKIEKNAENYGICYGEYDLHNIIVDTNNIHLFDFDRSLYGHYIYDVASFAVSILSAGYQPKRKAKDIILNTFLPWFRIGYAINKPCKEDTFDDLELFMGIRGVWLLTNLMEKYQTEELPEIKMQIDAVTEILLGKDIYEGIDIVRKRLFL